MGLIGVSINDAIVVLAALRGDSLAREGEPQAVREVVVRSTRHVVATSLTTMAGFTPLLLSGGGFWPPWRLPSLEASAVQRFSPYFTFQPPTSS